MSTNEDSSDSMTAKLVKGCLSDDEIEKTASLLTLVWPNSDFSREYLYWLYCENPAGSAETYNVWDKGQIVAHYAAIPVKAKLFGNNEKGLLSLNTAVHPLHRGKGYFKTLATRTFEDAHASGANFVVGVANANSTVLFRRQLRFQLVCPLSVKIGLGSIKHLSKQVKEEQEYVQSLDEQTLAWRIKKPGTKYRFIERNDSLSILCDTGRYGIWAIMNKVESSKIDMPHPPPYRWNPFTLWIGLDSSCDWKNSLYINLPDRFKASSLNLVFKDLSGHGRTLNSKNILFSLLDFDAF